MLDDWGSWDRDIMVMMNMNMKFITLKNIIMRILRRRS